MDEGKTIGRVVAVNIGKIMPLLVAASGAEAIVPSGIRKHPVSSITHPLRVEVRRLGLAGDQQGDCTTHGGFQKAVYGYPVEHYSWWNARRRAARLPDANRPLAFGAMGENLTLEGLLETELWVDDRVLIGSVELRVASPRKPSSKFNAVMGYQHAARHMLETGFSGFYFSVVTPGDLQAGDSVRVVCGPREISIDRLNRKS